MNPTSTGITLSAFDWITIAVAFGLLVGLVGFLIKYALSKMEEKVVVEEKARTKADLELASTLNEVAKTLNEFRLSYARRDGEVITRDELNIHLGKVDGKMDAFHERMDDIHKILQGISSEMVTKDECRGRQNRGGC
jgi:hypothetical protein